jgi:catechol 2,3-dioxygenase-like lactoylglutathione lyase family enzyme
MKNIEIISIPVTDQQRSKEFYKKLGFQMVIEAPMGNGETWMQMQLPGHGTTISLVSWFPFEQVSMNAGSLQGIVFETDDIKKEVSMLKKLGIEVGTLNSKGFQSGKIDDTPWGKWTHFKDPDGNGLNLHQK